MGFTKETP